MSVKPQQNQQIVFSTEEARRLTAARNKAAHDEGWRAVQTRRSIEDHQARRQFADDFDYLMA